MPNEPIVPRSLVNPVGGTDRINRAHGKISEALRAIESWLLERLKRIPVAQHVVNNLYVNKYRYEYLISLSDLELITQEIAAQLGLIPIDYVTEETRKAYEYGTDQAVTNLASITDEYTRNITQVLLSDSYQRRVALVAARTFEEMDGFKGQLGKDLGRILMQGIQDGLAPSEVADTIKNRFDISDRRAEMIARTEISSALRRGRWDEDQDTNQRLGIKTRLMWVSALSPTTRHWHATRHGEIYTTQAVREFYAVDGNAINCKCSQISTLVDDDGQPIVTRARDRLLAQKAKYLGQ